MKLDVIGPDCIKHVSDAKNCCVPVQRVHSPQGHTEYFDPILHVGKEKIGKKGEARMLMGHFLHIQYGNMQSSLQQYSYTGMSEIVHVHKIAG
jgi:hypothetical protein